MDDRIYQTVMRGCMDGKHQQAIRSSTNAWIKGMIFNE